MYLSNTDLQQFSECSMREFNPEEHHITRIFSKSVLILMFSGILRFTEDGKEIELKENEYYIQRQGLYQKGNFPSHSPKYFYIHFDGKFNNDINGLPLRGVFSPAKILPLINELNLKSALYNSQSFVLNGLFYNILGHLNQNSDNISAKALSIVTYIVQHYTDNNFSVDTVTTHFSYNKDYLIRLFNRELKLTPYQYITKLRIEKAKQLILYSNQQLSQISQECGYNDYSVFYKNFIRIVGLSPQDYRKQTE